MMSYTPAATSIYLEIIEYLVCRLPTQAAPQGKIHCCCCISSFRYHFRFHRDIAITNRNFVPHQILILTGRDETGFGVDGIDAQSVIIFGGCGISSINCNNIIAGSASGIPALLTLPFTPYTLPSPTLHSCHFDDPTMTSITSPLTDTGKRGLELKNEGNDHFVKRRFAAALSKYSAGISYLCRNTKWRC